MKKLFVLSLLLLGSVLLGVVPLWAANGHVKGQITNATTNKAVAGASISLIRIGPDRQDRTIGTVKSGANGAFTFPSFPAGADEIFMVQTLWQGKKYEQVAFDGTGRLKAIAGMDVDPDKIELTVYNKSAKMPDFTFLVHHLAIQRENRTLKCVERIVAQQQQNYVYDGSAGTPKIKLQLPPGAKNVALDPKVEGTVEKEGDFYYYVFKEKVLMPVGMARPAAILLNYDLDWPASLPWNRKLDISHKVFYPTNFFFVARSPDAKDLKVIAPRLSADNQTQINNAQNEQVEKIVNSIGAPMENEPALKAGETIAITIQQPVNPLVWAFVMFVGALIALVPLVLRSSSSKSVGHYKEEAAYEGEEIPANLLEPTFRADVLGETFRDPAEINAVNRHNGTPKSVEELIFSIAQLDEDFVSGTIEKSTYQSRRTLWKKELVALLDEGQAKSSPEKKTRSKK